MDIILDNLPCGYLEFNDEGILGRVNNRFCEMVGYSQDELINQHIESIFTPGSGVFYQTHLFPMLKMENRVDEIFLTLLSKEKEQIPVLINAERTTENSGFNNRCIVVWMQRRSEFEDRILYDKKKAEKTSDEREEFLSMMSHELRTPLSVILLTVDLLSDEINGKGNSDQYKYLGLIKNASKNLARLADDILNFAKLETGHFTINKEIVLLEEILVKSYMMVMHDAESKGLKLTRGDKTDLRVWADADRLQQVIMNLLKNAIKFTDHGGKIELFTEKTPKFVKVCIKDTGIGIPSGKIDQIFQPFIQMKQNLSDSNKGGFGLGLPISKKLARMMGGDLTVSSTPGEGSVFTLQIPLADS
ncbi:PAS domain-containing protein [Rhodohalobacter sp. SW132]|uniref:PAS domain-containing sensor histidine kinase n=1 Tax=Rhodohalobacter sp. SW132 TaxID=2293433 RepID=UPI000E228842|nr:PAS domain-containing sensor histidine kinase [Rhodohalobacter sp. SW132]REL33738.1 PAS domain-containing protein [Rhodohalobacter sp. SW132]